MAWSRGTSTILPGHNSSDLFNIPARLTGSCYVSCSFINLWADDVIICMYTYCTSVSRTLYVTCTWALSDVKDCLASRLQTTRVSPSLTNLHAFLTSNLVLFSLAVSFYADCRLLTSPSPSSSRRNKGVYTKKTRSPLITGSVKLIYAFIGAI